MTNTVSQSDSVLSIEPVAAELDLSFLTLSEPAIAPKEPEVSELPAASTEEFSLELTLLEPVLEDTPKTAPVFVAEPAASAPAALASKDSEFDFPSLTVDVQEEVAQAEALNSLTAESPPSISAQATASEPTNVSSSPLTMEQSLLTGSTLALQEDAPPAEPVSAAESLLAVSAVTQATAFNSGGRYYGDSTGGTSVKIGAPKLPAKKKPIDYRKYAKVAGRVAKDAVYIALSTLILIVMFNMATNPTVTRVKTPNTSTEAATKAV